MFGPCGRKERPGYASDGGWFLTEFEAEFGWTDVADPMMTASNVRLGWQRTPVWVMKSVIRKP
jgi:hypothetical protein